MQDTNEAHDCLMHTTEGLAPVVYFLMNAHYNMRGCQEYCIAPSSDSIPQCSFVALVWIKTPTVVTVHSQSPIVPMTAGNCTYSLRGCCSFVKGLAIEGHGTWLVDAFRAGSLIICPYRSYMPGMDPTRCSAATLFLCTSSGRLAT
jgi:hypothetical protein